MIDAISRQLPLEEDCLPGVNEMALRRALEEVRQLAAQSRLLALNAVFETAGARAEPAAAEEMETLGGAVGQAAAEAEGMVAAVELLLRQIESASAAAGPL